MNWNAIGAIGELLGAAGVIITLVYVAIQLRENAKATRVDTADRVLRSVTASQSRLIQDGELADIVRRGTQDLSSLEPTERMRVRLWFFELLRNAEQATRHEREGVLDRDVYDRWRQSLMDLLERWPEARVYLERNRAHFDPEFLAICLVPDDPETGRGQA